MAMYANYGAENGLKVFAGDYIDRHNGPFFCTNAGCRARMILCMPESRNAYFRSHRIDDHAFSYCVRQDLIYNPDRYDETYFEIEHFMNNFFDGQNETRDIQDYRVPRNIVIGGGNRIIINTPKTLYTAFINRNINGNYGDCVISDYLCNEQNYDRYRDGIIGRKFVELTFYKYDKDEQCIYFNYPFYDSDHTTKVKVKFNSKNDFQKVISHYHKLPDRQRHMNPIVILADWKTENDVKESYISSAEIKKVSQHFYIR